MGLTMERSRAMTIMFEVCYRPSSNGRTADFGSANRGSSPCGLTKLKIKHKWNDEDFLLSTEGPDVFDRYAARDYDEGDGYDFWKD